MYTGSRHQRGGGILSSFARFLFPTAKKILTETAKAAPGVIDAIVNKKQSAGSALLGGLKTVGKNTATDTLKRMGLSNNMSAASHKRRAPAGSKRSSKFRSKKRKIQRRDVFG